MDFLPTLDFDRHLYSKMSYWYILQRNSLNLIVLNKFIETKFAWKIQKFFCFIECYDSVGEGGGRCVWFHKVNGTFSYYSNYDQEIKCKSHFLCCFAFANCWFHIKMESYKNVYEHDMTWFLLLLHSTGNEA